MSESFYPQNSSEDIPVTTINHRYCIEHSLY